MPMPDDLTVSALSAALDASVLRARVHAANIANASVAGFVPMQASFAARIDAVSPAPTLEVSVTPRFEPGVAGQGVRIDDEVARISQNALHYQALIKGLNHYLGTLGMAYSEGRK